MSFGLGCFSNIASPNVFGPLVRHKRIVYYCNCKQSLFSSKVVKPINGQRSSSRGSFKALSVLRSPLQKDKRLRYVRNCKWVSGRLQWQSYSLLSFSLSVACNNLMSFFSSYIFTFQFDWRYMYSGFPFWRTQKNSEFHDSISAVFLDSYQEYEESSQAYKNQFFIESEYPPAWIKSCFGGWD